MAIARNVLALLALVWSGAAVAGDADEPSAAARFTATLHRLEEEALALDQLAAEAPAAQLARVTADEQAAWRTLVDAFRKLEALLDAPRPPARAVAVALLEDLESAWRAMREYSQDRAAGDRARMRDAAQAVRAAARAALDEGTPRGP